MVKKYTVDKKIIQELTRAVKELTKALEKSNLNKLQLGRVRIVFGKNIYCSI